VEIVKKSKVAKCYSLKEENIAKIDLLRNEIQKEIKEMYGLDKKITSSSLIELLVNKEVKLRGLM
jgi:hypothetical protein